MLTKEELTKRIKRDEEIYTQLSNERRTVYQRLRRYRNMLFHMQKLELAIDENLGDA
jgi:hypothetical protein